MQWRQVHLIHSGYGTSCLRRPGSGGWQTYADFKLPIRRQSVSVYVGLASKGNLVLSIVLEVFKTCCQVALLYHSWISVYSYTQQSWRWFHVMQRPKYQEKNRYRVGLSCRQRSVAALLCLYSWLLFSAVLRSVIWWLV